MDNVEQVIRREGPDSVIVDLDPAQCVVLQTIPGRNLSTTRIAGFCKKAYKALRPHSFDLRFYRHHTLICTRR